MGGFRRSIYMEDELACALGWSTEVAIATKMPKNSGYPSCYKIDIAEPTLKIGIEVDGASHGLILRKKQDRKKERLLGGLGWIVLRFSNRQVTERLEECVQTVLSTISRSKKRTRMSRTAS